MESYLDQGARKIGELSDALNEARRGLISQGDIPTLDPLSKAGSIIAGAFNIPLAPVLAPLASFGLRQVSESIDPYPPVRETWTSFLQQECQNLTSYEEAVKRTAEQYRESEKEATEILHRDVPKSNE